MPARFQRGDVGLALAERSGGGRPAAQLDIAGLIERGFVPADQRFQIAGAQLSHHRLVPGELRMRITLGAGEMRHAAARHDRCPQTHRGNDARYRLAKGVAALHRRLRRQVGIDVDRQDRVLDAEMGERDAHRVIDLGNAGEGRVEALPIQLPDEFQTDLARNLPAEIPAREPALGHVPDMDRERWCRLMKKLLGMVVRKNDPEIGRQGLQPGADFGCYRLDPLDRVAVLSFGHREELWGMGQHRPADYGGVKGSALHHQLRL